METAKNLSVSEKLRSNYDSYYDSGESNWRRLGAIDKVKNIVDLCSPYPHSTVLEIGSGDGSLLKRMSDLHFGESLYSIEVSKSAVETIKTRNIPLLAECKLYDGYKIPYEDKKFDLVVMSHIVEHVEHPRQILYEACRVAKQVFLEVPLEDNLRLPSDYRFSPVGHINYYSPKIFRRLVQTCEMEILSEVVTNPSYALYSYNTPRTALLRYLPKQFLLKIFPQAATLLATYHYSMICRKKSS